jgi:hypothetical protein
MAIQNLDSNQIYELSVSGSSIATNRTSVPFIANVRNDKEGFIYAPSTEQGYNIPALKNVLDVNITELIPIDETGANDLVPRPIYDDALEALATANNTISIQTNIISTQQQTISTLETEVESLKSEVDNQSLLRVVSEANSDNLRQQIALMSENIQNSLQRASIEGIQRASAEAKESGVKSENEALKQKVISLQTQIDLLNATSQGKDAQIAAGALSSKELTARVLQKSKPENTDLYLDSIAYNYGSDKEKGPEPNAGKWFNGPDIELYNPTAETQKISFSVATVQGGWLKAPASLTLAPNETKKVSVVAIKNKIVPLRPFRRSGQGARTYRGTLDIKTNTTTLSLSVSMYKHKKR